jgi:hypothetical protein
VCSLCGLVGVREHLCGVDGAGVQLVCKMCRTTRTRCLPLQLTDEPIESESALPADGLPRHQQGVTQQETLRFQLPEAVTGLRCVKKYAVGELSWDQTILMGDFEAGEHEYKFEASTVPTGKLSLGRYIMKTVFMDGHGQYLWAGVNAFQVVPPAALVDTGAPAAAPA